MSRAVKHRRTEFRRMSTVGLSSAEGFMGLGGARDSKTRLSSVREELRLM